MFANLQVKTHRTLIKFLVMQIFNNIFMLFQHEDKDITCIKTSQDKIAYWNITGPKCFTIGKRVMAKGYTVEEAHGLCTQGSNH